MAARLITGVSVRERVSSELLLARPRLEPLLLRQKLCLALMAYRPTRPEPFDPRHLISAYHLWRLSLRHLLTQCLCALLAFVLLVLALNL